MSKAVYPDISRLLAAKARGRIALAALSFADKLAILDQLKDASRTIGNQKSR
jgi:hypothetical protein